MPYKVIFFDEANVNVKEAKAWYKSQRNGLQTIFANSVKQAIIRMKANPEAFAVRYKNIRIIHPYKFPFSIHFYIDKDKGQIVITNILHDYRDIKNLKE
ncbi:MAG TPA: hypothetical protein VK588_02260 [Chitinophagaceae bacterium]|nr:hypothetical protein [Chitinophagaceae bacterium]